METLHWHVIKHKWNPVTNRSLVILRHCYPITILLIESNDFLVKIVGKSDAAGDWWSIGWRLPLRTTGSARRSCVSSRAREELIPLRSHGRGSSRALHRISSLPTVETFLLQVFTDYKKNRRDKRKTRINFYTFQDELVLRALDLVLTLDYAASRAISEVGRSLSLSLFLSSRLPSSLQLSRTATGTYAAPFSARVHRVSISRDLYYRKITAPWAPLLPDRPWITRSKSVRSATLLVSYALPNVFM